MSKGIFGRLSYSSSSSSTSEAMCLTPSSRASSSDLSALERQDGQTQASSPSETLASDSTTPQEGTAADSHAVSDGVELSTRDENLANMAILLLVLGLILSVYVLYGHSQNQISTRLAIRVMLIIYVCLIAFLWMCAVVSYTKLLAEPPKTSDQQVRRVQVIREVIRCVPLLALGIFLLAAFYLLMVLGFDWLASVW